MNSNNDDSTIRLRRELAEAKYRLYALENSRSARLAKFVRVFVRNPIRGLWQLPTLPAYLKKVPLEKPDYSGISEHIPEAPRPLTQNNPLLKYPHVKVACLGTLNEVADVCHAFEVGDTNWINLLDHSIDFVLVSDLEYSKSSSADKWLKATLSRKVPLVVVRSSDSPLPKTLNQATLVLDRTGEDAPNSIPDKLFVDILSNNPINWDRSPRAEVGMWNKEGALDKVSLKKCSSVAINEVSEAKELKSLAALVAPTEAIKSDFLAAEKLLEVCAQGVPVVTYGDGLDQDLPFERVKNISEAVAVADELSGDLEARERMSIVQRRSAIFSHSQLERFEYILEALNLPLVKPPVVSVIIPTKRPKQIDHLLDSFSKQNYPHKELLLVLHGGGFDTAKIKKKLDDSGFPYQLLEKAKETIFGDNLNEAVETARGDFVAKMDDDDIYGESHLLDDIVARRYSRADIVGKWSNWVFLKGKNLTTTWVMDHQEVYTHHLPGGTFLAEREFMKKARFGRVKKAIDSELYRRIEVRGAVIYSTHRYNYTRVRDADHTYNASDEEFLSRCSDPSFKGHDPKRTAV
jgi:hypothetical protein